jgi:hypothetical protein
MSSLSHLVIVRQKGTDAVWIDPFGRGSVSINDKDLSLDSRSLSSVQNLFEKKWQEAGIPFNFRASIRVDGRTIALPAVAIAVRKLCTAFGSGISCKLEVHFPSNVTPDLEALIQFCESLRALQVSHPVMACGRLPMASNEQMERMFSAACLGMFAVDELDPRFNEADSEVVSRYTDFGFLMPVCFWIGIRSLLTVEEEIAKALCANRSAGFTIPLVSGSAFFDPAHHSVPDPSSFGDFLIRIYKNYPFLDYLLDPLVELAASFRAEGCYSNNACSHSSLKFLIDREAQVIRYRQVPRWGTPLESCDWMANADASAIRSLMLASIFGCNPACRHCEWLYMCGGHDADNTAMYQLARGSRADSAFQTHCHYRTLFFEHFALQTKPISLADLIEREECPCTATT